ncbi:hypothetical protein VKT23_019587 [Stygiomarasmius scandens]|uniref:CxC2-like cysteine cluster KDZ transposase-associated domain-containing protein n=1 Tax=Marasmiellus scandens TaxID=2682957 RepID=A0ABR1IQ50_9AGAR
MASVSSDTTSLHHKWEQLMRNRLYPATHNRPRTACTFETLEHFHMMTLWGKITAYDYYKGLEGLTDNTGAKLPNRYPSMLRMVCQWRHLRMLRRGGRGNDSNRSVQETLPGELAVQCIACPQPGINLPDDWQQAPDNTKFIYMMFIAIDACFRLKRKRISTWKQDASLQDGWAYFVENGPYHEWVKKMKDQKEISTCTGLAALDYANTKFHEGYDETGKNGMGATQIGERYANVDFVVASLLRHISLLLIFLISYDIACQWSKNLAKRLRELPSFLRLHLVLKVLKFFKFVIPKLHILGHLIKCQEKYSLSYTLGVGETDAESIERLWSGLGPVSTSIKEMGPGSHHDTLEDHIGHWNWKKIVGLAVGALLKRHLAAVVTEFEKQLEGWQEFTQAQQKYIDEWKTMADQYESGAADLNPYTSPVSGKTAQSVRLELAKEAEEKALQEMKDEERMNKESEWKDRDGDENDDLPDLETSPGEFLYFGLEIEQQQRELRLDITSVHAPTNKQMTAIVDRRTKLARQIKRFRALQLAYMPVSLQIIATQTTSETQINAEEIALYLPSRLSTEQRKSTLCNSCLPEMEVRLRDGQLNESLNHLRQSLLVKQRMLRYKKINARNQRQTTHSRALIARQEKKVKIATVSYRDAWRAKLALVDGRKDAVGWKELLQEHVVCMEDLQEAEKKRVKAMKHRRREAARRELNGENPVEGAREKNRVPSWIWHFSSDGEMNRDRVLYEGLRIEWCKTYVRVKRWREEIVLLQEEMRRCLVTLEWQAQQWEAKTKIDNFDGERKEGASAYAFQQAELRRGLALRFKGLWNSDHMRPLFEYKPVELILQPINSINDGDMDVDSSSEHSGDGMDEDEDEDDRDSDEDSDEEEESLPGERDELDEEDEDEDLQDNDGEEQMEGDDLEEKEEEEDLFEEPYMVYTIKDMLAALEEDQRQQ